MRMQFLETKGVNILSDADKVTILKPIIITVQKFDEDAYVKFKNDFNKALDTGQNIIPIIIDSYGGQVYSLMGMIDIIKNSKVPVATILQTKAMSCGIVLFTAGTEGMRYMSPYSTLMMHDVTSMGYGHHGDIEVTAKEVKRLNDMLYEEMAKNCGHSKNFFKKIADSKNRVDWFIDSKQAIQYNIANHIGIPNFDVKVKMNITINNL